MVTNAAAGAVQRERNPVLKKEKMRTNEDKNIDVYVSQEVVRAHVGFALGRCFSMLGEIELSVDQPVSVLVSSIEDKGKWRARRTAERVAHIYEEHCNDIMFPAVRRSWWIALGTIILVIPLKLLGDRNKRTRSIC